MSKLPLPPARPVLRPLRDLTTAAWSIEELTGHRRRVTIDHQPLAGLTPDMLLFWFRNIGGTGEYAGRVMQNYLAWHPLDHIHWELAREAPGGGVGEGARFRIVEAFGADMTNYVDTTDTVEKLDATGIRLVRRIVGVPVLRLEHYWSACQGHVHYVTVLDLGARARPFRPVNRVLTRRIFPRSMTQAWLAHNIEEVGYLEEILPALWTAADDRQKRMVHA
jgi:hypothetical protein